MDADIQAKLKQLTESLQAQQTKVAKKKEEIETLAKSAATIDKELYELRQTCAELEGAKEFKKDTLHRAKEELKKKIDHATRIAKGDKNTLKTEKEGLQAKLEKLQGESKNLLEQKNNLLKNNKGQIPVVEETKNNEDDLRREEEENAPLETLVKNVEIKKEATGFLKAETVTKLVDVCVILAGRKFQETVRENRERLRAMKSLDLKAYLDQAGKEVSQHTEVYQEIEKQVLEAVGLEKNVLDKSIEYYMSTGNLEIVALMNLLGEKMKSYLKSTKEVSNEQFKEVLRFKNDYIEKEAPTIFGEENRRKVVQTQLATVAGTFGQKEEMSLNMLRGYFEFKLGNAVHEKFGVEEEDLRAASMKPEIQYDMEVAELMIKNEELMYKSMPQLAGAQPQDRRY